MKPKQVLNQPGMQVTFAIISFNQEAHVKDAIEGAFHQDYENLEIILSDDCSSDGTYGIMEKMARDYCGSHTIILNRNAKNLGIGAHVERVFNIASGKFIVMAAGDDVSYSNRTSRSVEALSSEKKAMAFISGYEYEREGSQTGYGNWQPPFSTYTLMNFSRGRIQCTGAVAAWSRELVVNWPSIAQVTHEDRVLPFRALLSGGKIATSKEPLVLYRRIGGISRLPDSEAPPDPKQVREKMLRQTRPDCQQRIVDLMSCGHDLELSKIEQNLRKNLDDTDDELASLRGGAFSWDRYHLSKLLSFNISLYDTRAYAGVRGRCARAKAASLISSLRHWIRRFLDYVA